MPGRAALEQALQSRVQPVTALLAERTGQAALPVRQSLNRACLVAVREIFRLSCTMWKRFMGEEEEEEEEEEWRESSTLLYNNPPKTLRERELQKCP